MWLNDVINNVFQQGSTPVTSPGTITQTQNANISAQIRALTPGQILQGQVLESTGDAVKLLVNVNGENISLQAKLEQNIALSAGRNLLFQVKNNGSALSLSPLLENTAMGETAAKALDTASLPLNEDTLKMTTTLMEEGISINKDTLQGIYQEVLTNQDAELMDIVDLHKLDLPVTQENLNQIHSYKEMTHQLSAGVEEMSKQLLQLVSDMAQNGQGKAIEPMLQDIFGLSETESEASGAGRTALQTEGTGSVITQSTSEQEGASFVTQTKELLKALQETVTKQAEVAVQSNTDKTILALKDDTLQIPVTQPEFTMDNKEALAGLIKSREFAENFTKLLQEQFALKPETVAEKEKVQEFFQKLSRQLTNISEALSNAGQEQSAASKTVQNMSQNVNFLNQMNQMYAYIQLPLKLTEGSAHGELYVYSNKKHLAAEDGQVSALLHLDMEHLGPMDVYVQMQDAKVSTKFYLQDDEMLDFISEHIDLLNARLEKRGYQMNCTLTVKDSEERKEENVTLQELIRENSNKPAMVNYSFDVRA